MNADTATGVQMLQTNLFGEVVTTRKSKSKLTIRHEAAERLLAKENELWKERFPRFVIEYGSSHPSFRPEDVRLAYCKTKLPMPKNWRSSGQLFKNMVKKGVLTFIRMDTSKVFGCPTPLYKVSELETAAKLEEGF